MIIKNAKIVTPQSITPGDIVIDKNGKISNVILRTKSEESRSFAVAQDDNVLNVKGAYVLPGLIEVHGHMREPGLTTKEDVPHGSAAAVAGGFTTIIDMPNTNPSTTTCELLKEKIEVIYPNRSHCDYAFFFGVSKDSLSELGKVNKDDIVGFKVFMAGHETTPTTISDDETLAKVFEVASKRNILLAVHAEDQKLINEIAETLKNSGRSDAALWSELRSKSVVIRAVERALKLREMYNCPLYLLHLSTPEEFELVLDAKKKGGKVFGEMVSYQLNFNTNDYEMLGNKIKVSPALRSPEDQNALWEILREQKVDVLCSEHTPHEWESKNQPNVWKAQSGMPNIQETLPSVITNWLKRFGNNSLEECLMTIAKLSSENPAGIFGFKNKGGIEVGKDADLVVLGNQKVWKVSKPDILSRCGWSAYEGMELLGRPKATFVRGNLVYNDGKVVGKPLGTFIKHT